jgi:hypothetical protein
MNLLDRRSARRKASTYTQDNATQKNVDTSMPLVGFEPTIPVFVRPKTVRASERSAIGTADLINTLNHI